MERVFHVVPAGSSIIAMIPYRVVNMDMKKVMALAMMALMVIPSMTITVGAQEEDMTCAIERAQIYLEKVIISAEATAALYDQDHIIHKYLNDLYDLLGEDWEESPDFLLDAAVTYGVAERSEDKSYRGTYSVHLETTGIIDGDGDARIVIPMPEGFTLGDLETLSWWEYLVAGYPPHVDVYLDMGDELVFEYACNNDMKGSGAGQYGAETGAWFSTFNDNPSGLSQITDTAKAWANSGPPGGSDQVLFTLAEWKAGQTYTTDVEYTINSESIVTKLEIEIDNWIVQTETYVDDIKINEDIYDFEEEPKVLGAKGYLDRASMYLDDGDFKSAARCLASARNILGRINGLLRSMAKAHKVTRTEKFERRIQGIRDKMERQKGPKDK